MSRISVDVSSARIPVLQVGYQGENEVTDVLFDISSWITEFGEGVAQLRVKRPGNSEDESYVLSLTITDGKAVWTVSETDTANKGNGKVQLSYMVGNIVKKAVIYPYKVGKSIVGADNPVDPFDSWIERSKAWAIGKTLHGDDVPETDETYQNNAKYYAEQADILGSAQVVLATEQATLATAKATLATEKADAAAASETNAAASEAAVNGVSTQLTTRMSAIETEQSVQSARMDTFTSLPEGSTSGNAELADIRVGSDGTTYDTAGNAVRGQISGLKSDLVKQVDNLEAFKSGINIVPFSIVRGEYAVHDGSFTSFEGWSRTDYIFVKKGELIKIKTDVASDFNNVYDANKTFLYFFATQVGEIYKLRADKDLYIVLSNTTAGINGTSIEKDYKGVIDDLSSSDKTTYSSSKINSLIEGEIKIVMPSTLIALVDEEFDVHYDNIIQNYDADLIPYKEAFGGATYGMKNFGRNLVNVVHDISGSFRFGKFVPDAYNTLSLPESIIRVPFTFKTISKDSGSGLNRKVLLIGDSWTAPGLYARELRNLFADENEPMNITLLGTLGDGGAEVGAPNGYHEGHGSWSSKTFCTMQTYNGYTSHFYNPSSKTFDFSYYMSYCGYTSVDDVFINLGINDVATMENFDEIIGYYNQMINSIRSYNSSIKIFIGLCGLPAEYEYSGHNNCQRSKSRRLLFHERLMTEYGNKENEGLFIVPLHLSIDNKHDFKVEQKQRSFRDSTLVDYCIDTVHPSDIAYNKIADRIRTYIKYAETV